MKKPTFGLYTDQKHKWQPKKYNQHFKEISQRLEGVILECLNFSNLIERYDRPWTLFYCDPPFVDSENLYVASFEREDHERLAKILRSIKGRFILSYNDHPEIWKLYEGLKFRQVEGKYTISKLPGGRRSFGELVITNF